MEKIILASKSPRRKEILESLGYKPFIDVSHVDEETPVFSNVKEKVVGLAKLKAEEVAKKYKEGIIIAADTLVYFEGKEIGQQKTDEEAQKILNEINGKKHEVYTGLYLINIKTKKILADYDISQVTLKKVKQDTINAYVKAGNYKGKAGAYNISDPEFESFIEKIEGSQTNIMGMPKEKIQIMIQKIK